MTDDLRRRQPDAGPEIQGQPEFDGTWPADDLRRAFVRGAQWWEFHSRGATMWPSDRDLAEGEADRRYPGGQLP